MSERAYAKMQLCEPAGHDLLSDEKFVSARR
jgi:hypothetical protein